MLRIDDPSPATTYEYVECTGVSGTTLTVTRGQEGTTGIAHTAGAFVGNEITAGMLGRIAVQGQLKAKAYRSAALTLNATGMQKVPFDATVYDPNGNVDVTTNHRWNCPLTGTYLILGLVSTAATAARATSSVFKNGVELFRGSEYTPVAAGVAGSSFNSIEQLTAGDYLELFAYNSSGTPALTPGSVFTYLAVHFLSL